MKTEKKMVKVSSNFFGGQRRKIRQQMRVRNTDPRTKGIENRDPEGRQSAYGRKASVNGSGSNSEQSATMDLLAANAPPANLSSVAH